MARLPNPSRLTKTGAVSANSSAAFAIQSQDFRRLAFDFGRSRVRHAKDQANESKGNGFGAFRIPTHFLPVRSVSLHERMLSRRRNVRTNFYNEYPALAEIAA
jgi:hypothetical protein